MIKIYFKNYDKNNNLDTFNKVLSKASCDRYELRQSKKGNYYLYDYEESEYKTTIRNKKEIKDILDCQYLENFTTEENDKIIKEILSEV